ncbi:phage tail protein [Pedobacter sp. KLB.chiD]|uniref:phage tail protein n=1 Tax=Pedobacter sp. KLB.chiD TaxID=3387402 RepID=UPI00399A7A07
MANKKDSEGFCFELSFKGENIAFQEITGISKELNLEDVAYGGENRFKYRLPDVSSGQNLILKRAVVSEGSLLNDWCASCMDGGLDNTIITQDISLSLLDSTGRVYVKWAFHHAYPVKYSVSDLKSQENTIIIESIELVYNYFRVIAPTTASGNEFN